MVEQKNSPNDSLSLVFHALSDPTRREILQNLAFGNKNIRELSNPFSMSFAAVSKHIKVLENAGLIQREKRGRQWICRFNPPALEQSQQWIEWFQTFWEERLDALDEYFKSNPKRRKP